MTNTLQVNSGIQHRRIQWLKVVFSTAIAIIYAVPTFCKADYSSYLEFYDNPVLDSRKCGQNTRYFLKYLAEKGKLAKSGYVVAVYEDSESGMAFFDARWGELKNYKNGEQYRAAKYYFHVFAVLDGKVYDFSQSGPKVQELKEYLKTAFLPKSTTVPDLFGSVLDKREVLNSYLNLKMELFTIEDYIGSGDLVPTYSGKFYDLFEKSVGRKLSSFEVEFKDKARVLFTDRIQNENGTVTYLNPVYAGRLGSVVKNGFQYEPPYTRLQGELPKGPFSISAIHAPKICNSLGHRGFIPKKTVTKPNSKGDWYVSELYGSFQRLKTLSKSLKFSLSADAILREEDIQFSGPPPREAFYTIVKLTCGSL